MNKPVACLRAVILALVAALALSPALIASSATAATPCQSSTAKLAKSQHALKVARKALAKERAKLAKAKKKHQKAKVKKQKKVVAKKKRVVNARSAQVRRDTAARKSACASKPGNQPQGTQQPDQLGILLRLIGSLGGGTPTTVTDTTQLVSLLNGFQAGLGDQFDPATLTSMLAGYQSALPVDPSVLAGLLGTQWDASQITNLLSGTPDTSLITDLATTVAMLLDTLAGDGFTPPSTIDAGGLGSLVDTLLGLGGGTIPLPSLPPVPCIPLLTC